MNRSGRCAAEGRAAGVWRGRHLIWIAFGAALVAVSPAAAQDATWVGGTPSAASSDYGTSANWTPAGPPPDTAFFNASANSNISIAGTHNVGGWTFNSGASAYTFANSTSNFAFVGAGITINGGSASITNGDQLHFQNSSTAGSASITHNNGVLSFNDSSSAGSATIIATNNAASISFSGSSTAGSAHINSNSNLSFFGTSTAGSATITNNFISFFRESSTAGSASIANNNGLLFFIDTANTTVAFF